MIIHQSVRHLACILDDTIMSEIKTENSTDEFFNSKNELLASQLWVSLCNSFIQSHFDYASFASCFSLTKSMKKIMAPSK